MHHIALAFLAASMLAGCYSTVSLRHETAEKISFPPEDRTAAYGRALTALQARGYLIKQADPIGGLIRTEVQSSAVPCSNTKEHYCSAYESSQLTVSADGVAFLRTRWLLSATQSDSSVSVQTQGDADKLHMEMMGLLRYIAGKDKSPPAVRPQPPGGLPALPRFPPEGFAL